MDEALDGTAGPDERARRDYAEVFGTAAGGRVLADLARRCHAEDPTYVPGDALESAYREGRRSVWLRLHRLLNGTER